MEIFEVWPVALFVAAGLLGLVVGSFLNVVAYRLPLMMERAWRAQCAELQAEGTPPQAGHSGRFDLWWPPSACPSCATRIAARHNVPVLGFLALRGRCASCGVKISSRYPIVEACAGLLALVVAYRFGATWQTVAALGLTWTLLALTLIDLDHKLLPDSMTLPLVWAGLLVNLPLGADGAGLFVSLPSAVVGAAAGYVALWSVYQLFKLLTGKEGMGYGDFKLLGALGAWLGWQLLPLVILLSALVGSVVGIAMIVFGGRSSQTAIPFGPYLAGAGWLALLWGDDLVGLYQAWFFG